MVRVATSTNTRGSVTAAPRRSLKYKSKLKPTAAPRAKRLNRATGKRSFRQFSAKNPFRALANSAYKIDHSPFQLSMKAIKLRQFQQPLGMDEHRKSIQRKIIWYWQFSGDWNDASIPNTAQVQSEVGLLAFEQTTHEKIKQESAWLRRWHENRQKIRNVINKRLSMRICQYFTDDFRPTRSLHYH